MGSVGPALAGNGFSREWLICNISFAAKARSYTESCRYLPLLYLNSLLSLQGSDSVQ